MAVSAPKPCLERLPDGRGCPNYAVPGGSRCREHGGAASPSGRVTQSYRWRKLRRAFIDAAPKPWRCGICGELIVGENPEVDHIVPISQGGDPWLTTNLRLSHKSCNSRGAFRTARRRTHNVSPWMLKP